MVMQHRIVHCIAMQCDIALVLGKLLDCSILVRIFYELKLLEFLLKISSLLPDIWTLKTTHCSLHTENCTVCSAHSGLEKNHYPL